MFKQIRNIVAHEFQMELKSKGTWPSVLLFVFAANLICYLTFKVFNEPIYWSGVFWIVLSFNCLNAASQIFKETPEQMFFMHQILGPKQVFAGKLVYNFIFMLLIGLLNVILFSIFFEAKVIHLGLFTMTVLMGSALLGAILTVTAAISYKASGSSALNNILSIPLIIPVLVLLLSVSTQLLQNVKYKDFIQLEIYQDQTFPVLAEVVAIDNTLLLEDAAGNRRSVDLIENVEQGKSYQFEGSFSSINEKFQLKKIGLYNWSSTGIWMKLGVCCLLFFAVVTIGWWIFPYFWNSN